MPEAPAVSLTVVVYNSADGLRDCLESVRPDLQSGFAELLVVDNASPDDSPAIVQRECPEAQLIRSERNRLFAGGCNLAWPHVRGRYWLLLNPDVVVPPGGLQALVAWMDEHPRLGAASPELIDTNGLLRCAGRRFPSLSRSLLELCRLHLLLPEQQRAELFLGGYWRGDEHLDVDWVPGAALIARRQAIEQVGLLAEDVQMYGEDCEWCWRLRRAGWQIGVCGRLRFQHKEGSSTRCTWSEPERRLRMWRGIYSACQHMRGRLYSRLLLLVNGLAFAVEAWHPRRSASHRHFSKEHLRAHCALLRSR